MKVKIAKQVKFKDASDRVLNNYQIYYKERSFWVSEKDFENHKELMIIEGDDLILRDPPENYYVVVKKKNKNGEFLVILPKENFAKSYSLDTTDKPPKNMVEEVLTEYRIKGREITSQNPVAPSDTIPTAEDSSTDLEESIETNSPKENENSFREIDPEKLRGLNLRPLHLSSKEKEASPEESSSEGSDDLVEIDGLTFKKSQFKGIVSPEELEGWLEDTEHKKPDFVKDKTTSTGNKKVISGGNIESSSDLVSADQKIKFINSLITLSTTQKIDDKTRERLFGLVGRELEKAGGVEEEILREVREIKAGLTIPQITHKENPKIQTDLKANGTDQKAENAITTNEFIILGPHNPLATVKFLSSFTTKDPIKYLTHKWDKPNESFDYVSFIASVQNSFYDLLREFIPESENSDHVFKPARLPLATKSKVYSFVLKEEPEWSFEHIKIGWSSKVLKNWCLINPGKYPDDFEIPKEFQMYSIKGKEIRYVFFKELIKKFKNEIEIRTDDMQWNLKGIMRDIIQLAGLRGDFKIHLDDSLSSVQCFIDVAQLRSGLKYILEPMRKFPQHPEIEIKAKFCGDHYKLLITHKGSSFKLQQTHPKFNGIQGDFGEARKRFFWQCDWRVEGKFATKEIYSIDYLKKGANDIIIEPSEFTEGIRHTIKLYL